jgi:glycosyltransferase involved in cell wall biosynthesis
MSTVLHVAPFDPSRYPPLIHTVRVSEARGVESVVVASLPVANPGVLGEARIVAPEARTGGAKQQAFLVREARREARERAPRLVIAHNTRGLVAASMAAPFGAEIVYHCHDFDGLAGWRGRDAIFLAGELAGSLRASEIWVPAGERVDIARARKLRAPTILVRNCPRTIAELPEKGRLRAWLASQGARGAERGRIITRHGLIGHVHYIRETIEALPLLPEDVIFAIIGDGDRDAIASYREAAARLGLSDRVLFHPFVAHTDLLALLIDADAGMNVYVPSDLNAMTPAPNKVFENMALGVPIVVAEGNSVARDVLTAGAGLAVPVGSREALADALGRLIEPGPFSTEAKKKARAAHLATFNYEAQLRGTCLGAMLDQAR